MQEGLRQQELLSRCIEILTYASRMLIYLSTHILYIHLHTHIYTFTHVILMYIHACVYEFVLGFQQPYTVKIYQEIFSIVSNMAYMHKIVWQENASLHFYDFQKKIDLVQHGFLTRHKLNCLLMAVLENSNVINLMHAIRLHLGITGIQKTHNIKYNHLKTSLIENQSNAI